MHRLAAASPGEAGGLSNTYTDHPVVQKMSVPVPWQHLSLTSSAVKICAAAEGNVMVSTGCCYMLGTGALRRTGGSSQDRELCRNSGPEPCHSVYQSCPCHVIRSKQGLLWSQASSSTQASCLWQRDCKGGSMKNTRPLPKGCVGALPCCLGQFSPPVAFPMDHLWEQHVGALQAPCATERHGLWWGAMWRLQLTHGGLHDVSHGNKGGRSLGWQGCCTCPVLTRDKGSASRLLSREDMPSP